MAAQEITHSIPLAPPGAPLRKIAPPNPNIATATTRQNDKIVLFSDTVQFIAVVMVRYILSAQAAGIAVLPR